MRAGVGIPGRSGRVLPGRRGSGALLTATLSARAVYSPPGAWAQVFVSVAALKVAAGSIGAPIVGAWAFLDPRVLLVAGGALIGLTAAATVVERRVELRADAPALVS